MKHYDTYAEHKGYVTPSIGPKHIKRFEQEIWDPGHYHHDMSILEIGCGTGLVLANLRQKGVQKLIGIDQDTSLEKILPGSVVKCFQAIDVWDFLEKASQNPPAYDRIILFDVLEHFSPEEGQRLLGALRENLLPNGAIHLKVPNAGSPWGLQFQFGDLTHMTAYTPESLRQQAIASGLRCQQIYPQRLGSPIRNVWQLLLNTLLNKILPTPPEIWEGNFYAILEIHE